MYLRKCDDDGVRNKSFQMKIRGNGSTELRRGQYIRLNVLWEVPKLKTATK